ncbi:hypothetical protein DFH09DRAFT_1189874 [Mycena vulgaris]|nr:hypothetical protein DFH09DRAFT_1189874 [Mycena vulgaris]
MRALAGCRCAVGSCARVVDARGKLGVECACLASLANESRRPSRWCARTRAQLGIAAPATRALSAAPLFRAAFRVLPPSFLPYAFVSFFPCSLLLVPLPSSHRFFRRGPRLGGCGRGALVLWGSRMMARGRRARGPGECGCVDAAQSLPVLLVLCFGLGLVRIRASFTPPFPVYSLRLLHSSSPRARLRAGGEQVSTLPCLRLRRDIRCMRCDGLP